MYRCQQVRAQLSHAVQAMPALKSLRLEYDFTMPHSGSNAVLDPAPILTTP